MTHIQLNHISKAFQDGNSASRQVLSDFSLSLEQGSFTAIMGPSGVGKTTLLRIMGTLIMPDSGTYQLGDTVIRPDLPDLSAIRNSQIGFLYQDHRLLPQLSALDNVLLPLLAQQNRITDEQQRYAFSLMQQMGVDQVASQLPQTLSGGEQSRVTLCRALICRPSLLLADEPTGQLDAVNAQRIMELLHHVNDSLHTTIVMVTHSERLASGLDTVELTFTQPA